MNLSRTGWSVALISAFVSGIVACAAAERPGYDEDAVVPERTDGAPDAPGSFGEGGKSDAGPPVDPSTDPVNVIFTADNAYAFAWGDAKTLANFESRPNTTLAGDIFNCPIMPPGMTCTSPSGCGPEAYVVPAKDAPPSAYLYVIAWSDQSTTQGALGQFKRGTANTLYTGDAAWEVCATGVEHDPSSASDPGPSKADVEAKIALCTAGDPSMPSHGWVDKDGPVTTGALGNLAVGEDNARSRTTDPGGLPTDGVFPISCQKNTDGTPGIDGQARWMWYQPAGFTTEQAFTNNAANATKTYLIFRVKAADIPVAPVN